jgi:cob(I)alamin adenosyltransferase
MAVRLSRITTRTGDAGTSALVDGSRRAKSDAVFAAMGDVDETNCAIGCVPATGDLAAALARIQNDLFDLGADIATPAHVDGALRIVPAQVLRLEEEVAAMNAGLEPLDSFVLPGGAAAALHLARSVARRAERSAVAAGAGADVLRYLNRLSDWLFVAARVVARDAGGDRLWVPAAGR